MIRAGLRLAGIALWCLLWLVVPLLALALRPFRPLRHVQAGMLRLFARGVVALLGVRVTARGAPPPEGAFVASNHWGYVDVFVLGSLYPGVFVSRADVKDWPALGWYARRGGTIFLERTSVRDAARVARAAEDALREGVRVTAFLEGGAGPGTTVRPFRSPLLAAPAATGSPCVAAAIRYRLPRDPGLDPSRVVAWLDASFPSHFLRLLRAKRIDADVAFAPPRTGDDRKALARQLEQDAAAALAAG